MIDLEECGEWIKNSSFKKICLQIPDYLMIHAVEIILYLQKYSNAFMYIIGDTSYDNCCSDKLNAERIQADACIHFGHACLSCFDDLPTFYVFIKQHLDINLFCSEFNQYFQDESKEILLFYDTSFAYTIEDIYKRLKIKYENLILSTLNCNSDMMSATIYSKDCHTTILGRKYNLPIGHQLEIYDGVFLGSHNKTLITLSMSVPVNSWHHFDGLKLYKYNIFNSLWLKRRNFLIEKIRDAKIFGIIIASLNVENYLMIAEMLRHILNKVNKKIYLFNVGKINPTKLANFYQVDIFVAITCPESSLIDSRDYLKPIVTPFEIELAFNEARIFTSLHVIDFKQMLPGGLYHKKLKITAKTDISLLHGNIRNIDNNNSATSTNAITEKTIGKLVNNQINSNFFHSRTWNGLDQKLGESNISVADSGRNGIPINYENELHK